MITLNDSLKRPLYYALGVHGAIVVLILISMIAMPQQVFQQQPVNIVQATTLHEPVVHHKPVHYHPREVHHHERTIKHQHAVKHVTVKKVHVAKQSHKKTQAHHAKAHKAAALSHQHKIAEQKRLKALHAKQIHSTIAKYQAMILQSISQHWLIPPGVNKHLQCELDVRLAPDGTVQQVKLLKSSGNVMLDRSAIAAVYKASPLPLPKQKRLYDDFKALTLIVTPKDVIA